MLTPLPTQLLILPPFPPWHLQACVYVCLLCLLICHCLFPCPPEQCKLPVGSDFVLSTAVAALSRTLCAWHRVKVHGEDSLNEGIKEMV